MSVSHVEHTMVALLVPIQTEFETNVSLSLAKTIVLRLVHLLNTEDPILVTEEGIVTVVNAVSSNAHDSIVFTQLHIDTDVNLVQLSKQPKPIVFM